MTGIGTKSLSVGVFEPKLESKHEGKSDKEEYKTANGNTELPARLRFFPDGFQEAPARVVITVGATTH